MQGLPTWLCYCVLLQHRQTAMRALSCRLFCKWHWQQGMCQLSGHQGSLYASLLCHCPKLDENFGGILTHTTCSIHVSTSADQDEEGKTFCKPCPAKTRREPTRFKSVTACVCEPGAWNPDPIRPYECLKCPVGGICEGSLYRPYAMAGYWQPEIRTARTLSNTTLRAESDVDGNTSRCYALHLNHSIQLEEACRLRRLHTPH